MRQAVKPRFGTNREHRVVAPLKPATRLRRSFWKSVMLIQFGADGRFELA